MRIERLRNDAHIGDARLLDRVHYGGESTEWNIFIRTDEYRLVLRVANLLAQLIGDLVDIHGVVAHKNPLLFVDAYHHALFGDLLHRARFGDSHLNPRRKTRSGHNEDNEQNKNNVNQGRDVYMGEGSLSAPIRSRKGHYRRTSAVSGVR